MNDQISSGTPVGGRPPPGGTTPHGSAPPPSEAAGETAAAFTATLAQQWASDGVRHAVIAPGSRSTPMALALDAEPRIELHVAHDERVAAFMALGIGVATATPAIVACTSGTAATHFHAAVVEADLAAVPLIVVTADRPPELQGVLAPQTINQRDLYGKAVRWYCEPGPPAAGSSRWWRDLANDALGRCTGNLPGPVHLNLAFREPFALESAELPEPDASAAGSATTPESAIRPPGVPWALPDEEVARLKAALSSRRGLVVAGARTALDSHEVDAVFELADALGWPVLADPLSGVRLPREGVVTTFDSLLRSGSFARGHRPQVVLHLGGLPASKALREFCRDSGALHVAADRHGRNPDPDHLLAASLSVVPSVLAGALLRADLHPTDAEWRQGWTSAEAAAREAIEAAMRSGDATEPAVALDTAATVVDGTHLVVSSSMPVRDIEWFAAPRSGITVHANRGANGIDGVTSTAVGVSIATGAPTVVLTGDVAMLHDIGTFVALGRRELDLTVVVVDNDGGGIFGFLPQASEMRHERFERLFGTPHGTDLAAVASAFGLPAASVNTRAGFKAALAGAQARGGTRVIVVSTDRADNVAVHARIHEAVAGVL